MLNLRKWHVFIEDVDKAMDIDIDLDIDKEMDMDSYGTRYFSSHKLQW